MQNYLLLHKFEVERKKPVNFELTQKQKYIFSQQLPGNVICYNSIIQVKQRLELISFRC